jgi:gas vesicle protein
MILRAWDHFSRTQFQLFANQKEVTMSDNDEFGAFLVGFIVGGLSGAVVALLFAPQTGEETRALIKDKSIELRDRAQMTTEEALARAEAIAADARARADELAQQLKDRGQGVVQDVRERGKSAVEAVRRTTKRGDESSETTAM